MWQSAENIYNKLESSNILNYLLFGEEYKDTKPFINPVEAVYRMRMS